MGDIRDDRSCAVPYVFMYKIDRPHHRIMIEYDCIEIARTEYCFDVMRVIACSEPRGDERQWTSQRNNSRIWSAWHNVPLDPTLERFCGPQRRGCGAREPHEGHRCPSGHERLSKVRGVYIVSGIERQRNRARQPKA